MDLILRRNVFTDNSTIGDLLVNDEFFCYTLEDKVRPIKVPRETAIPVGQYEIVINFSNRFNARMPLLLYVPHFEGIRIHSGNTSADTEGCILVGETKAKDWVGQSRAAFNRLFPMLDYELPLRKVFITILEQR